MNIFDNISLDLQLTSWSDVVINILIAFVLGLLVSWVYRRTHRGFSYSVSFVHTLMLLSMVTALVMMVIGESIARAFSLVGALSIIRFRTPVKDTKDTAFVFFALAIGMATGTGTHITAVVGTAIISLIILIIHRFRLGEIKGSDFLLRFRLRTSPDKDNVYQDVFNRYLRKSTLMNMTTLEQGTSMELAFNITFKKSYQQQEFLRELNAIAEIEHAMLIAADEGEMS
ncbi:DUF4956 domain-containing protein [bacterium]|nr:DUF4956 domain-containing protein [bacterium]